MSPHPAVEALRDALTALERACAALAYSAEYWQLQDAVVTAEHVLSALTTTKENR